MIAPVMQNFSGLKTFTLDINNLALVSLVMQMSAAKIPYHMDQNNRPGFSTSVSAMSRGIDCSGFVRYAIFHSTADHTQMPDGSVSQHEWCLRKKFATCAYRDAAKLDNVVRIGFIRPVAAHAATSSHAATDSHVGHVWLILNGQTIESHGRHKPDLSNGPGRRPWDSKWLKSVASCFVLSPAK